MLVAIEFIIVASFWFCILGFLVNIVAAILGKELK